MQLLISAKLLCEYRQRGLESNLTSRMLGLLFILQALGYSLEAKPTIWAVCTLRDQETNAWLLNFGDCNRHEMALLRCFCIAIVFSLSINCAETISRVAEHRLLDPGVFGKENYPDGKTRAFQL